MRRPATVWLLDLLGLGYAAYLAAAFLAALGILVDPGLRFPFAGLGAPLPLLLGWLLLRRMLAPGQTDPAPVNWFWRAPAWIWVVAYAAILAALSVRKHAALESHGSDLGIFVNLFWNLSQEGSWHSGMLERHFLGEHFSPLLLLIVPLYRLWPAPECLLVVQSAALALGAWPLYLLARSRLGHEAGLAVLAAYMLYPPLMGIALHDFHEVSLAVPLLAFAAWWISQNRMLPAVLALAAAVLCKEELALTAAMVGVYLVLARRDWKTGGALAIAGWAVFLFLVTAVLPSFRGEAPPFADRYSQFSGGLKELAAHAVRDPAWLLAACWNADKGRYLLELLRPLGFLPVLAPLECLPALPTLARNLLSNHEPQYSIHFHYPAPMVPFLFAALVAGLERARNLFARWFPQLWIRRRGAVAPAGAGGKTDFRGMGLKTSLGWLLLAAMVWGVSWPARFMRFVPEDRVAAFRELKEMIPAAASVSAHNRLVPHVANRRDVCTFPVVRDADFILLDFGYPGFEYPVHAETHRQRFLQLLAEGSYRILALREKFVLLQRQAVAAAEPPGDVLDELFFRYCRENLRCIACRRDVYWQGAAWLFPPGRWRAIVELDPCGELPGDDPVVLSVHPYLGGRLGEWSLGEQTLDSRLAAAQRTISWEFDQPRRQMLSLRIRYDRKNRIRLRSVEFQPADAAKARAGLLLPETRDILGAP